MSRSLSSGPAYAPCNVIEAGRGRATIRSSHWLGEAFILAGFLLLIFLALIFRLRSVIVSDMDEGTYLYAGKLIARGAMPYRDFLLAHPPLIALLAGGWERIFGSDVMPARIAYMVLILAGMVPLYLVGRALARTSTVGLLSVAVYTAGMVLLANMGRTVRLEPLMNVFLIAGFACYLLRPDDLRLRPLIGALFMAAILVKLVAIVPLGLLVVGDFAWIRPGRRFMRSWLLAAAGASVVLAVALPFIKQPGFIDDVVGSQLSRSGLLLRARLHFLVQDSIRYPAIMIGLISAAWFVVCAKDPRVRIVSILGLGNTLILVLAFQTFFGYYLVQVLPWLALLCALVCQTVARSVTPRWWRPLLIGTTVAIGFGIPLLYDQLYYRRAYDHVSSPERIVAQLRGGRGYLYSMYPSFALWSGRDLYPWYGSADSLIPRTTGHMTDADFIHLFSGSEALVLWPDELKAYPKAAAYVGENFHIAYEDRYYTLWVRSASG